MRKFLIRRLEFRGYILIVILLKYARLAGISTNVLIDDDLKIAPQKKN